MGSSDVASPAPAPLTSTIAADVDLSNYDDEQVKLMEEMCIVIDRDDKRIGADSKKTCRLLLNFLCLRRIRIFSRGLAIEDAFILSSGARRKPWIRDQGS
jgi:hypothetical protein